MHKVCVALIYCFSNKLIICHEEPENVLRENCSSFWRYLHNGMCSCTALYHSSILLLPCWKVVNKLNCACTVFYCGLQKPSNFDHIVCNVTSVVGGAHEIYISSPASPDHWITFLHLGLSWRIASLQSKMFSHFIFHHINLEWRASSTVQSIFEPSTYGTIIPEYWKCEWGTWLWWISLCGGVAVAPSSVWFSSSVEAGFFMTFLDVLIVQVILNLLLCRLGRSFHWILCDGESAGSSLVGLDIKSGLLCVWDVCIGGV